MNTQSAGPPRLHEIEKLTHARDNLIALTELLEAVNAAWTSEGTFSIGASVYLARAMDGVVNLLNGVLGAGDHSDVPF